MDLGKTGLKDLVNVGMRPEIAESLVQEKTKGNLRKLSEVIDVLEKCGTRCQVTFDDNFKIELGKTGEVELQLHKEERGQRLPEKQKGKSSRRGGRQHEQEAHDVLQKKRRLETEPRSKNRKAIQDEEWELEDDKEEDSEEEDSEEDVLGDDEQGIKLNVNTASEEELETIQGIGPFLARKIVKHREKQGKFNRLEDLSVIKGISRRFVKSIDDVLGVTDDEEEERSGNDLVTLPVDGRIEGREVIRIMSWNLQCFSDDKAKNKGVMEVICRTILEKGISIAVIQEIGDKNALQMIQEELNRPTLKAVKKLKRPKSYWECITSDITGPMFRSREFNGFLFDSSRNIEIRSHDILEKPKEGKKQFARRPFLGFFKAKGFDFVVVSVHLKATGLGNEDMSKLQKELGHVPDIAAAIKEQIPGEKDIVIVGDFNLEPDEEEFDSFREVGLSNLIPHTSFTNISTSNMDGSKCYDNIWISKQTMKHYFTGRSGVFRDKMTHPSIPDGWKMGGVVSDHCPVWAEFYCDRDVDHSADTADVEDITIKAKA